MRFVGKSRLGFYPLPLSEAQRIRRFLLFPDQPSSALDPCVGDGVAFEDITGGAQALRYGVELDAYRAEQAKQRIHNVVQGNALEVQCPVECFGLLYLNPPYDWALGPADSRRTEQSFLSHTYRWLKPAGILVLVIPSERLAECSQILASHFRDVRVYRLEAAECVRYKQVVVIGVRRTRRGRERLTDSDITRARLYYAGLARNPAQITALPSEPEARYNVPVSGPAQLVYRGLPLDEMEHLLPQQIAQSSFVTLLLLFRSSPSHRPESSRAQSATAAGAVPPPLPGTRIHGRPTPSNLPAILPVAAAADPNECIRPSPDIPSPSAALDRKIVPATGARALHVAH